MRENTYRNRENGVPRGGGWSGCKIKLREVRGGGRENFVVRLMMISFFHVLFKSFFSFFSFLSTRVRFQGVLKGECKEERICASSLMIETHPISHSLVLSTSLSLSLCPSPCPPPKRPGSLVPTVSDCQLTPPPCPPPPPPQAIACHLLTD